MLLGCCLFLHVQVHLTIESHIWLEIYIGSNEKTLEPASAFTGTCMWPHLAQETFCGGVNSMWITVVCHSVISDITLICHSVIVICKTIVFLKANQILEDTSTEIQSPISRF